ncbi:MAG: PQQ-binding-like beta-propeller repeat protein, partial [bacterium]
MTSNFSKKQPTSPVRWWPAAGILTLTVVAVVYIWAADFSSRQMQIQWTGQIVILAILLLLVWLLFFSRLRWKVRLFSFGAVVLMLGLIPALFRMRGISGDILPILEWRWTKSHVAALPASPPIQTDTTITATSVQSSSSPESAPSRQVASDRSQAVEEKAKEAPREFSTDYPQFLGPHRNATVNGIRLNRDWSKHPPKLVWRQPIGAGWSAFAVSGNLAITQEQRGNVEMVVAYDLKSGQVKWSHGDSTGYESPITGNGPRATPTIAGNRVYTLGGTGILNCLDLATGKRLWSKDIIQENNSQINGWGMSGSPLILDSLVVVSAGGRDGNSLVAYHQDTGARIWSGGNDRAAYSS